MKKCPECGEVLMDSTAICPVCGYKFEVSTYKDELDIDKKSIAIPLKRGGNILFEERMFLDKYPPFLENILPAVELFIKNNSKNEVIIKLYAFIEKYAQEDRITYMLKPNEICEYKYYPVFDRKSMGDLRSYATSVLFYKVDGDVMEPIERKSSIIILSYGDILWKMGDLSFARYIIKWVTPGESLIRDELLNIVMEEMENIREYKELMKSHGVGNKGGIFGMQFGKEGIYVQTWALYNALKRIGIRYKSTPVSILEGYQRVRLPKEVLKEKGGNCIDLTVTFASALEAMGLIPVIILTQSHAFPGVLIPKSFLMDYVNKRSSNKDLFDEIDKKYDTLTKKYILGNDIEEKSNKEGFLGILDDYLVRCCGNFLLPIESTMIPDFSFEKAVINIFENKKMNDIEEVIVVPEARRELGYEVLPYENVRLSTRSSNKNKTKKGRL